MSQPTIIDSGVAVPNHGQLEVTFAVEKDDAAYVLTGKSITATVRREADPDTVINAALEAHAMTTVSDVGGTSKLTLTTAQMAMLTAPISVTEAYSYIVTLKVVEDDYRPHKYRIWIERVIG